MDLAALYAAVPAAEEEDLLEEMAVERERAEDEVAAGGWPAWLGWPPAPRGDPLTGEWDVEAVEPAPEPVEDDLPDEPDGPLPPLRAVLGLLHERLGAEVLREQ